jgi:hypothetical protein
MIITNYLTYIELSAFSGPIGTTQIIGDAFPGGAITAAHLSYRTRKTPGLWLAWQPVAAWDQVTRTVTVNPVDPTHTVMQIRRQTPRFFLYDNPLDLEDRVDQESVRINANQGYMVAYEWASEYGIDPRQDLIQPDYTVSQPIRMLTQSHYGPTTAYGAEKEYDFWFSGGYLKREHVRCQVLTNGVWVPITLDTQSWQVNNNPAPNKFIGPWTLQLDLSPYSNITGIIISRFTPRTGEVSYPEEGVPITELNMDPSSRHAFYVAVELGERLSKIVPCECLEYFTTLLYPVVTTDEVKLTGVPIVVNGTLFGTVFFPVDEVQIPTVPNVISGTLALTYVNYTMPITDDITISSVPVVISGTLAAVTINYSMLITDDVKFSTVPVVTSGTLNVVIVSYSMPVTDDVKLSNVPSIISGTLI